MAILPEYFYSLQNWDAPTQAEGLSTDSLISKAVEDFLFIHRFRNLRDRLIQKAEESYTDEDIFEMVS